MTNNYLTTDDGLEIFERNNQSFVLGTKHFENERLGDAGFLYTCVGNYMLRLRCVIVDIVFLTGGDDVEILYLICKRGNRVVRYD